jgi:cbb3-type cytochrome oxidase subunit 3
MNDVKDNTLLKVMIAVFICYIFILFVTSIGML